MAVVCDPVERRPTVSVLQVLLGAGLEQQLHALGVAAVWRHVTVSVLHVLVDASAEQRGRVVRAPAIPDDKAERLLASLLAAAQRKGGTAGAPISTSWIR